MVVTRRLALALTITAVVSFQALGQRAPATPNEPWIPDDRTLERRSVSVPRHEVKLDEEHVYSLGELIDIAESNSPTTQAAWNRARLAAASDMYAFEPSPKRREETLVNRCIRPLGPELR
jgi:outer membrane protein